MMHSEGDPARRIDGIGIQCQHFTGDGDDQIDTLFIYKLAGGGLEIEIGNTENGWELQPGARDMVTSFLSSERRWAIPVEISEAELADG
jgi:hypothetical protein